MTILFHQKEWLSFDEALRYSRSITKDEITENDLLPILLEKKVPISILQTSTGFCFGDDISFGYLFFCENDIFFNKLSFLKIDFDELRKSNGHIEDGYLMALGAELDSINVNHVGYFYDKEQYDFEPVILDVVLKGVESVYQATFYYLTENSEKSPSLQATLHRLTWSDLLTKTHKFRGHLGLDGGFIKPFFKRMAIDNLLSFDKTPTKPNILEHKALKIKVTELEHQPSIEKEPVSTLQAIGIMAQLLASSEQGHKYRKGEDNKPNAKAIGDAVANKARIYFGADVRGFDSFNKKISESLKLLEKK